MPPKNQLPRNQRNVDSKQISDIQGIINCPANAGISTRSSKAKPSTKDSKNTNSTPGASSTAAPGTSFGSPGEIGSPKSPKSPSSSLRSGLPPNADIDHSDKSENPYTEFEFNPSMFTVDPLITDCNHGDAGAMSDALNQMYWTLVKGQHKFESYLSYNEKRFRVLSDKLDSCMTEVYRAKTRAEEQGLAISNLKTDKVGQSQFATLQSEIRTLKSSKHHLLSELEELKTSQAAQLKAYDHRIDNNKLDIKRVRKANCDLAERVNSHDIKDKHLFITVDGLPESRETSTAEVLISRMNDDANISLSPDEFASIFRVGKPRKAKAKPCQNRIKFVSEEARSNLLSCRGKLKPNKDKSLIWINEDHPEVYKRRKIMLRDLIKHINGLEGHKATIESGGLRLDGKFYGPDQFSDLPSDC